jgi:LemA protein
MPTIIIVLIVLLALALIVIFNSLIRAKNKVDEAWSGIEVQLKRRYDLIPNVIETVKGYAQQESSVLNEVTNARTTAMSAGNMQERLKDENQLTGALKSLFAVSESYPDLKSNQNFAQLQNQLADTEDKIQAARRFYNGNVNEYNTKIEVFPNNMLAGMLGFKRRDFFDIDEKGAEGSNVKVQF